MKLLVVVVLSQVFGCTSNWVVRDADGDGVTIADGDCWDSPVAPEGYDIDPKDIYPGAPELFYDGIDADCARDDDFDADGDGWVPDGFAGLVTLGVEGSGQLPPGDCWDMPDELPDAFDVPDGVEIPAAFDVNPGGHETWYDGVDADCADDSDFDADVDDHEILGSGRGSDDDCNDADPTVNPSADEVWYDDVDSDCAEDSDYDADGDLVDSADYGGEDCDDFEATTFPGADDAWYDGEDSDCAGDDDYDADLDGHSTEASGGDDCDDGDADINPEALETWYDGLDSNCDDWSDYDADYDSIDAEEYGGLDCDDTVDTTYFGALDVWYDGVDSDCFGNSDYDADGDGFDAVGFADGSGDDCDDTDAAVSPDGVETCGSDYDDDCDGDTNDEDADGCTTFYIDEDGDGWGYELDSACFCEASGDYTQLDYGDCLDSGSLEGIDAEDVNPDALEECDQVDNDCNDLIDEDDPGLIGLRTWYRDRDDDGFGNPDETTENCEQPASYVSNDEDCDDTDDAVSPDADELCSTAGTDDDCDGEIDEASAVDATTWYYDGDGDGFGDADTTDVECTVPTDYVSDDTDCDDDDSAVNPDADELCSTEGIDDDCDGEIDEDSASDATTWYLDNDGDGFGDAGTWDVECLAPSDYIADDSDCDDGDSAINPDAVEVCDDLDTDEDCNDLADDADAGVTDPGTWWTDTDGDGYGDDGTSGIEYCDPPSDYVDVAGDCDDGDAAISPDGSEVCDALDADEDCDGLSDDDDSSVTGTTTWYTDADGDGYGDETDAGAEYCDGPTDTVEGDNGDCNDGDAGISPGGTEVCDAADVDEDCDGLSDDDDDSVSDQVDYYPDGDADGYGDEAGTVLTTCEDPGSAYVAGDNSDCDDVEYDINPGATEICDNGIDDDCDDTAGSCGLSGTIDLATDADAEGQGSTAGDFAGSALFTAGDFNGDGLDDMIIGAKGHTTSFGAAFIVYGSTTYAGTVDLDSADVVLTGETAYGAGLAGFSVSGGLDMDGDGYDDVMVGAPEAKYLTSNKAGRAYLVYGPVTSGTLGDELTFGGETTNWYAGYSVALIEDQDGDDTPDFLVGSLEYDYGSVDKSGGVYLFQGPVTVEGSLSAYDALFYGVTNSRVGVSVASAGDADGDGLGDLLMASKIDNTAYLALGPVSGDNAVADHIDFVGETATDEVGTSLAGAGDVNDDGFDDFIVGAPKEDANGTDAGAAYLILGTDGSWPADLAHADAKLLGREAGDKAGKSVGGDLDVNADGYSDLIVGAYEHDTTLAKPGAVYIVSGPVSGTFDLADAAAEILGTAANERAGETAAKAGDVNGDGYGDVLIGAPQNDDVGADAGAVYLMLGGGL